MKPEPEPSFSTAVAVVLVLDLAVCDADCFLSLTSLGFDLPRAVAAVGGLTASALKGAKGGGECGVVSSELIGEGKCIGAGDIEFGMSRVFELSLWFCLLQRVEEFKFTYTLQR